MAGKYNRRHHRGLSRYPERLKRRGVTNVDVRMDDIQTLRNRASRSQVSMPPGYEHMAALLDEEVTNP
jgi:hypothetical protein